MPERTYEDVIHDSYLATLRYVRQAYKHEPCMIPGEMTGGQRGWCKKPEGHLGIHTYCLHMVSVDGR